VTITLDDALNKWSWLHDMTGLEPVEIGPFGDVVFKQSNGTFNILNVNSAEFRTFTNSKEERELLCLPQLVADLESAGLHLRDGKCYGLKPLAIFKSYTPENMYVATAFEYISFMGDFYGQIKDLPDGTTLQIKVHP
jgi:hypothetical protein